MGPILRRLPAAGALTFLVLAGLLAAPGPLPDVGAGSRFAVTALAFLTGGLVLWQHGAWLVELPRGIAIPTVVFVAIAAATWPWAYDRSETAREMLALLSNVILFGAAFCLGRARPALTPAWLGVVALSSGVTLALATAFHVEVGLVTRPKLYRPDAWTGYPELSVLASMCAAIVLAATQRARGWTRWMLVALLAAVLAQSIVLYSRLAYLSIAMALAVALLLDLTDGQWRRVVVVVGLTSALASGALVWSPTFQRLLVGGAGQRSIGGVDAVHFDLAPASTRTLIWQRTLRMIGDHPAGLGVGLGNFRAVYEPNYNPELNDDGRRGVHAHNAWLHKAAELGLAGGAAFAALWALLLWTALRCAVRTRTLEAYALLYLVLVLLVQNLGENFFWLSDGPRGRLQGLTWMVMGLVAASRGNGDGQA